MLAIVWYVVVVCVCYGIARLSQTYLVVCGSALAVCGVPWYDCGMMLYDVVCYGMCWYCLVGCHMLRYVFTVRGCVWQRVACRGLGGMCGLWGCCDRLWVCGAWWYV